MSTNAFRLPRAVFDRGPGLRKVSLVIAALSWAAIVAALFVAWLATPGRSGADRGACESWGRAGERCPETAFTPVAEPPCESFGRGGSQCPIKP